MCVEPPFCNGGLSIPPVSVLISPISGAAQNLLVLVSSEQSASIKRFFRCVLQQSHGAAGADEFAPISICQFFFRFDCVVRLAPPETSEIRNVLQSCASRFHLDVAKRAHTYYFLHVLPHSDV